MNKKVGIEWLGVVCIFGLLLYFESVVHTKLLSCLPHKNGNFVHFLNISGKIRIFFTHIIYYIMLTTLLHILSVIINPEIETDYPKLLRKIGLCFSVFLLPAILNFININDMVATLEKSENVIKKMKTMKRGFLIDILNIILIMCSTVYTKKYYKLSFINSLLVGGVTILIFTLLSTIIT